jgi:hypothetical protein
VAIAGKLFASAEGNQGGFGRNKAFGKSVKAQDNLNPK